MVNTSIRPCAAGACGWGYKNRDVGCDGGNGSCVSAYFIGANESDFHPRELEEATMRIKQILDPLAAAAPAGRTLSLLQTPFGTVLAYVKHGEYAVTSESADEEIVDALGLILESKPAALAY